MRLLSDLPRNSRACLMVEPLWSLFGGVIVYFGPLYMKDLGLSDLEMGIVSSVGLLASSFFFILSGPLTNKYGRRITSLIWDCVSWSVSMVIWACAQGYVWFLVAVVFNSAVRVVMVSWNLLLTEDATPEQRVRVYGIVNIIGSLGGFVTLAAGLLLSRFGVVPTMRVTYAVGAVSMTAMFILRFILTVETRDGAAIRERVKDIPLARLVAQQAANLGGAAKDGRFALLGLVFLIAIAVQSFTFFQIIYLKDGLGYSTAQLALVPAVNSLVCIVLTSVVMPRVPKSAERTGLFVALALCVLASAAFLALPSGAIALVLLVQGLGSAAFLLLCTYRDSVFMNSVPGEHRAELFGLVNMLAMLLSIPTGALAGWLFSLQSLAPFVAVVLLYACGAIAALRLVRRQRAAAATGP